MKSVILFSLVLVSTLFTTASLAQANDPLKVHQFTLENGLKVYFSQNKQSPEFYSQIVVRAGSKHEPADATGLAHYLEHLLFKGTKTIGTANYAEEAKLNQKVIDLYEARIIAKDPAQKAAITKQIDEASVKAAAHVIPGEYDRLYSSFGQNSLNAHTWYEETVYKVGMPKNRFAQWAKVEAERFQNPVLARTFQWELEVVYEEKNRGADNPAWGVSDQLWQLLFPTHEYGRGVIGTTEHLKNPSIVKVREYFDNYYLPNNISIVLAGDLEPTHVEEVIRREFSSWQRGQVPEYTAKIESPITERKFAEMAFIAEPSVNLAYRIPGIKGNDLAAIKVIDGLLGNGSAGLMDEMNSKQLLKGASSGLTAFDDYSALELSANVKAGQTHAEVEKLLLSGIEKIKKGEFDESLLVAVKALYAKNDMMALESNNSRVNLISNADIHGLAWTDVLAENAKIQSLSKDEVTAVASKYFGPGYAVVYRKNGKTDREKIEKPKLTPISGKTAEGTSAAFTKIMATEIEELQPVFVDFANDIDKSEGGKANYFWNENPVNVIAGLTIEFAYGLNDSKEVCPLVAALEFAETKGMSSEQRNRKLFELGVDMSVSCDSETVALELSGIEKNLPQGLTIAAELMQAAQLSSESFNKFKQSITAARKDKKRSAQGILGAIDDFMLHQGDAKAMKELAPAELQALKFANYAKSAEQYLNAKRNVFYTGRKPLAEIKQLTESAFKLPEVVTASKKNKILRVNKVSKPTIYFYNRPDMSQALVSLLLPGAIFDPTAVAAKAKNQLFIEFFSGSMGAVVFQEIREKRALAYSARATYSSTGRPGDQTYLRGRAGTQSDKLSDTVRVFHSIIKEVPWNESGFSVAKQSLLTNYRSSRVAFRDLLEQYVAWRKMGYSQDPRKARLEAASKMELSDVSTHIDGVLSSKAPAIVIVGDKAVVDLEIFKSDYELVELNAADVFIY